MTQPTPPRRSPAAVATATVLIVVAIALPLVVPSYARSAPKLGDFPFFYWYQLILVPVIAILCWLCYLLLRIKRAPAADSPNGQAAQVPK
jgi:cytochrome bd-type quinol oxidase subunit 2